MWGAGGWLTWASGLVLMLSPFMGWYVGSDAGPTIAVTGWHTGAYAPNEKPAQQAPTKECLTSYQPPKASSFLKRLSFQASIGQAF